MTVALTGHPHDIPRGAEGSLIVQQVTIKRLQVQVQQAHEARREAESKLLAVTAGERRAA